MFTIHGVYRSDNLMNDVYQDFITQNTLLMLYWMDELVNDMTVTEINNFIEYTKRRNEFIPCFFTDCRL